MNVAIAGVLSLIVGLFSGYDLHSFAFQWFFTACFSEAWSWFGRRTVARRVLFWL